MSHEWQMWRFGILVCSIILAGCTTSTKETQPTPTEVTEATPTSVVGPPTLVPTLVAPPPTPVPTLMPKDAYALLTRLMRSNGGCRLPCWWGVVPGRSTALQAQTISAPLLGIAAYSGLSDTTEQRIGFRYPGDDLSILLNLTYLVSPDHSLVNSIRVDTQALRKTDYGFGPVYGSAIFDSVLQPYTLAGMLSTFGPPPHVILSLEIIKAEPTSPDFFYIWILYPEQGIIARYTGEATVLEGKVRGCPSKTFVDLWLFSPGDRQAYEATFAELTDTRIGIPPNVPYLKPIREATNLTTEDFYQTYKVSTDACFDTPWAIWPPIYEGQ